MRLDDQYEQAKHSLRRTKPRSKRRTVIERNLVHIQIKRIKRELKGKVEMSETAEIGHNSNAAAEQLLSIIKRVETMEEQKKATIEDIKDIYQEAASSGFDVPALKAIVRARTRDRRAEGQA
jgi:uncharacterized protein (UPF0335 family)